MNHAKQLLLQYFKVLPVHTPWFLTYTDKCEVIAILQVSGVLSRHQRMVPWSSLRCNTFGPLKILAFSVSVVHCMVYIHRFAFPLPTVQSLWGVIRSSKGQICSDAVPYSVAHNAVIAVLHQLFTAKEEVDPDMNNDLQTMKKKKNCLLITCSAKKNIFQGEDWTFGFLYVLCKTCISN